MQLALVWLASCADTEPSAEHQLKFSQQDAGPSSAAGAQPGDGQRAASAGESGPWGHCGPSPLAKPVPPNVIEVAEEALRPGGWAAQDIPGYGDATKCRTATLGSPYRYGRVDTRMLDGSQTPDSFVVFNQYVFAWFCDGRAAGRLDVGVTDGEWQVMGHGTNAEWEVAVSELGIDFSPECTRAYLVKEDLGSWAILTDKTQGVIARQLFSLNTDVAHTKAEFADQLSKLVGR